MSLNQKVVSIFVNIYEAFALQSASIDTSVGQVWSSQELQAPRA